MNRTETSIEDLPEKPMSPEQAVRAGSGGRRASASVGNARVPPPRSVASATAMRRVLKAGGSLAALMLLLPVTALAHGRVAFGTPNVIHACKGSDGVLRQITSGRCKGSKVVHWSVAGPAGATGPAGAIGPAGSPDNPDQVRDKFFQGTACPGNDASDVLVKVGPLCVDVYEASLWDSLTGGRQVASPPAAMPTGTTARLSSAGAWRQ